MKNMQVLKKELIEKATLDLGTPDEFAIIKIRFFLHN